MCDSILDVALETAKDLNEIGLISESRLREYENLGLPKVKKYKPKEIRIKNKVMKLNNLEEV